MAGKMRDLLGESAEDAGFHHPMADGEAGGEIDTPY